MQVEGGSLKEGGPAVGEQMACEVAEKASEPAQGGGGPAGAEGGEQGEGGSKTGGSEQERA